MKLRHYKLDADKLVDLQRSRVGQGRTGKLKAVLSRVGLGNAGQVRAWQGKVGQGRARQGRAGRG